MDESLSSLEGLVSIVIPTLNSEGFIERCLSSIKDQSYASIEVVVVDGFSGDTTAEICLRYTSQVHFYGPNQGKERIFGAPYQRNFGVERSHGEYVYYVDADMRLSRDVIASCVRAIKETQSDAVIVPEMSLGKGFWSECRALERSCHLGNDLVEAPRFFKKTVWQALNGFDPEIGGDDWDLYHRLKSRGFGTTRISDFVIHDEGDLTLSKLVIKRYVYGKRIGKYLRKYRINGFKQFSPLKGSHLTNLSLLANRPVHAAGVLLMRTVEYTAGLFGLVGSELAPSKPVVKRQEPW